MLCTVMPSRGAVGVHQALMSIITIVVTIFALGVSPAEFALFSLYYVHVGIVWLLMYEG